MTFRLLWNIARALWRSGLVRMSMGEALGVFRAWWRCGSSYAALAAMTAVRFPSACALHDEQGTMSFAQVVASSDALATSLWRDCGLRPGQQAALLCRNHRGFVVGLLALSRLGVDVLVLSTDSPARALSRILAGQPTALVLHDADFSSMLEKAVPQVRRRCLDFPSTGPQMFATDAARLERSREALDRLGSLPSTGWGLNGSFAPSTTDTTVLPRLRRSGQIVVLTSGSTGVPKRVGRRPALAALLPPLAGLLEGLNLQLHRPALVAIPLHHGYGLATLAMTLAMAAPLHLSRRLDIGLLAARLPADAGAVLVTVPTLLQRFLRDAPVGRRPTFAAVISGSAPLDAALSARALDAFGPVLFNLYGSTEAGLIAMAVPQALSLAPGTVGLPLPGSEVRLLGPHGEPIARGNMGRIHVRGPLALHPGPTGWLDTGDLGREDCEGRLFVCGRADAMFVSGGENVYPEETEATLLAHPSILDAAVSVVPDTEFGQSMVAWVVPRPNQVFDEAGLRDWLRERLERAKLPRRTRQVDHIPRNALGKVDRAALAEHVEARLPAAASSLVGTTS